MSALKGCLELGHSLSGPSHTGDPQTWGSGEAEWGPAERTEEAFERQPDLPRPAGTLFPVL